MDFFATAAKGTEPALRDELREMHFNRVRADRGGVHFEGEFADGQRACLWSRVAMRILLRVGDFDAPDASALYAGVRAIDWKPYLTASHTLAVSATSKSSVMTHTQFIAQKTKDAVVDQLRDALGSRPSVSITSPDVRLSVHLAKDHAQVYLDLAGEPLHKRGYRTDTAVAPLKETLAAAILRLSGWDRDSPVIDPMCGSGTFGIEAALWARNIAPGLSRQFGFERWASHDERSRRTFEAMRVAARAAARGDSPEIIVSDYDETAVAATRANSRAAGVTLTIARRKIEQIEPASKPGLVVVNPPYGERLAGDRELYQAMVDSFERFHGYRVAILSGTPKIEDVLRVRPKAHTLFNGPIECRLLTYDVR